MAAQRAWRVAIVVAVGALTVGACGSDGSDSSTDDVPAKTIAPSPSVTSGSGTTEPGTTEPGTTEPATPESGTVPFVVFPPPSNDGVSPEASGCTPPSPSELPDGIWFGTVTTVDPAAGTLGLDLACLFYGDAANAAAAEDGASEVPVPNDYWVRDQSENTYTLRALGDVPVGLLEYGGGSATFLPTATGLDTVADVGTDGMPLWAWVEIVDGWVVAVQQQYFP